MKKWISILILLALTGCSGEYDGLLVKDKVGNIYEMEHRIGVVYAINKVDIEEIKKLDNVNNN